MKIDDWYKCKINTLQKQKNRAETKEDRDEIYKKIREVQKERKDVTGKGWG